MNLTPEEQFNQEVLWILEEIKKEQLATPKGEEVEFTIRLTKGGFRRLKDRENFFINYKNGVY